MMLNYGGMGGPYWSGWSSGNYPYIAMDNLIVTVTDDQGNVYDIDSSMTLDITHTAAMTQRLSTTALTLVVTGGVLTGIVTESV